MKRLLLLLFVTSIAFGQSVPNGTITQGQVWTPTQWNTAWQAKTDLSQASTGYRFAPNAVINRQNDRTFIGGATVNDGKYPPVSLDWLSSYEDSVGYTNYTLYGNLAVLTNPAVNEGVGITGGASTIAFTNALGTALGIESFAVHNNPTYAAGAWAFYGEAHKRVNSGVVYGAEFDVHTGFAGTVSSPYNQGDTIGLQLADGAGVGGASFTGSVSGNVLTVANSPFALTPQLTFNLGIGNNVYGYGIPAGTTIIGLGTGTGGLGTYTLSASLGTIGAEYMTASNDFQSAVAAQIWNNVVPWNKGIVFGQYSVLGTDGVNGTGIAMALAKGHQIQWYNSTTQVIGQISATAAGATEATLNFSGSGSVFQGVGTPQTIYSDSTALSGTTQQGILAGDTFSGTTLSIGELVQSNIAASTAVATYRGIEVTSPVLGSGATIPTTTSSVRIDDITTGSTNIRGVDLEVSSGTGKYNLYVGGSAQSFFGGALETNSNILSQGTTFTLGTGTGACATTSTLTGGAIAGSFVCTGTAGASTETINLPAATHGYHCAASDATSGVSWANEIGSATTGKIAGTVATSGDVITFFCMGY